MKLGDYLTIKQAAELSGYSERHLRYLAQKGDEFDCVKVGGVWFIPESSLHEFIAKADEKWKSDKRHRQP